MQRILVLLLALVVGIASMSLAAPAEPFADVPANHWSYDAVKQLAAAGIIDGYKDGTFRGSKSLTRYEMAGIVANALTKVNTADEKNKALIEKLKQEYATELQSLGVRVSKIEKNFKDASLGGEFRFIYAADSPSRDFPNQKLKSSDQFWYRYRIWFNMPIDKDTSVYVRLGTPRVQSGTSTSNAGFDSLVVTLNNQLGLDTLKFGKIGSWGTGYGWLQSKSGGSDGVYFEKKLGPKLTWRGTVIDDANSDNTKTTNVKAKEMVATSLMLETGKNSGVQVGYFTANEAGKAGDTLNILNGSFDSNKGYVLGVHQDLGKWFFIGEYIGTTLNNAVNMPSNHPKAWMVQLSNGVKAPRMFPMVEAVDYKKPHTDAWVIQYGVTGTGSIPYMQQPYSTWHPSYSWPGKIDVYNKGDNLRMLSISYQNVLRKNVVATFEYCDIKIDNRRAAGLTTNDLDKSYKLSISYLF